MLRPLIPLSIPMAKLFRNSRRLLCFVATTPVVLCFGVLILGCSALAPRKLSLEERLAFFPSSPTQVLTAPVTIHWNEYQVPFIEAQTDADLAFALGVVHLHLREGQMMVFKRAVQGRLAEMAGPLATDIDHALRILGLARAVPSIEAKLPAETRSFLESFVAGLNFYQEHSTTTPPELGLLGIEREPWSVSDVLSISRLAGADVNWFIYASLLAVKNPETANAMWSKLLDSGADAVTSFSTSDVAGHRSLGALLVESSRSGSNSVVVSGARTSSGKPLIANDPHLGLRLPNFWLIAGLKSPSYHAIGMMIPGVPIMGLGRNECLAWGGTNMRAASSDLYDVTALEQTAIIEQTTEIAQRFWFSAQRKVRLTPFGPILTDSDLFPSMSNRRVALRWVGHTETDEISAFLRASQACTANEFRDAFSTFGVSGQNMLFATTSGDIGQVAATIVPARPSGFPRASFIRSTSDTHSEWDRLQNSLDLPMALNPNEGFLASANNKPTIAGPPVGFAFSANDRIDRLKELLRGNDRVDRSFLMRLLLDVRSNAARRMARIIAQQLTALELAALDPEIHKELSEWSGDYSAESRAALVFELMYVQLVSNGFGDPKVTDGIAAYQQWSYAERNFERDFLGTPDARRKDALRSALKEAGKTLTRVRVWGDIHRLSVGHALAAVPVLGQFFIEADLPANGSRETVMKTAHGLSSDKHNAQYGSQSRHVSDLSDPDANYFVLLGGQDGWLGSANYADQLPLWSAGEYVRVPLQIETVRREFSKRVELKP